MTNPWGSVADWVVAIGTLTLAILAAFQDRIRRLFFRPMLSASITTGQPDCHFVPLARSGGIQIGITLYLRLWITNAPDAAPAQMVEVYARQLERERVDKRWERVPTFPPMNLTWSHQGGSHYPLIAPGMGKHCDLARVSDPAIRSTVGDENPSLNLTPQQTSLAFELIAKPNHLGHIVGPGHYRLTILVAAGNGSPIEQCVDIDLRGAWYANEAQMLRDGIGVSIGPRE